MGNRMATADKVIWNCGLDVTTKGVKYRATRYSLKRSFVMSNNYIGATEPCHKDFFNEHVPQGPYELRWQKMKLPEH